MSLCVITTPCSFRAIYVLQMPRLHSAARDGLRLWPTDYKWKQALWSFLPPLDRLFWIFRVKCLAFAGFFERAAHKAICDDHYTLSQILHNLQNTRRHTRNDNPQMYARQHTTPQRLAWRTQNNTHVCVSVHVRSENTSPRMESLGIMFYRMRGSHRPNTAGTCTASHRGSSGRDPTHLKVETRTT